MHLFNLTAASIVLHYACRRRLFIAPIINWTFSHICATELLTLLISLSLDLDLDLAHVSIPVGKGLLAGKVADLAVPRSQCGKDPSPTVVASG